MELGDLSNRKVDELSGGQRQRVAISRALAFAPDLLLFDEPLAHLEASLRIRLEELLVSLQSSLNIPFIFVTHSQEEAMSMSTKLIVIKEGQVIEQGAPKTIYENPKTVFGAEFLGHSNLSKITSMNQNKVTTQIGEFELDARLCSKNSDAKFLMFRAEDVIVSTENPPSSNSSSYVKRGYVRSCLERGHYNILKIGIIGNTEDNLLTAIVSGKTLYCQKESVWVSISKADTCLLMG